MSGSPAVGIIACGVTLSIGGTIAAGPPATYTGGSARGEIIGISGLGANRKAIENVHNSLPSNWIQVLYSCLARLKPFQVRYVIDTNSAQWITDIQATASGIQILWPAEFSYTTGGGLLMLGAMTDVDFGFADIESRVEGTMIWTPSGKPYVVPASS